MRKCLLKSQTLRHNIKNRMRILVVTLNAWNDSGSTGNTISNLLAGSEDLTIANLYCRNEPINNKLCTEYFQITEDQIIKSLYSYKTCGRHFVKDISDANNQTAFNPLGYNKTGNFLRKNRPSILLFLREWLWFLPVWKNSKLDDFLINFNPDVIYMHGHANIYMHRVLDYCAKVTKAKVVLFFGDDMYGRKAKMPLFYIYETWFRKRLKKSIRQASLFFGGSLKLCEEYSVLFEKNFHPLFKQCDLTGIQENKSINNPIRIVYAGNMLFGREKILVTVAKAVCRVNTQGDGYKMQLIVYSNTQPAESSLEWLNKEKNTIFMGCKPYDEVCKALNESDLSLFVESFDKENIKKTRLSFSTKIIDCMQSNSAMLAIGPSNIASMEYIKNNSIGYTINNMNQMYEQLSHICKHPESILLYIKTKNEFAKQHHCNTSKKYVKQIKEIV